jgi:hypothetical protein
MLQSILDAIFSSLLLSILAFIVAIIISFAPMALNNKKGKFIIFIKMFFLVTPVPLYLIGVYSHFGYVSQVENIQANDKYFCFIDYNRKVTSPEDDPLDTTVTESIRLNVGDVKTGHKTFRKYIGHSIDQITLTDNLIYYKAEGKNNMFMIDTKSSLSNIEEKNIKIYKSKNQENTYCRLNKLVNTEAYRLNPEFVLTKYDVLKKNPTLNNSPEVFADLRQVHPHNINIRTLFVKNTGCETDFINPEFMLFAEDLSILIIKSSLHKSKNDFLISAVDLSGRILWKLNGNKLDNDDFWTSRKNIDAVSRSGNSLIFNSGGFFYSVDIQSGAILWKKRY